MSDLRFKIALAAGLLLFCVAQVRAEVLLRIALLQNAPEVTVSSEGGIEGLVDGQPLRWEGEVRRLFVEARSPIRINGKPLEGDELLLRPSGFSPLQVGDVPFRGVLRISQNDGLLVINEVGLESYLRGVVPLEISSAWRFDALKVQAVISRTYALYQKEVNAGRKYDLVSSVQDQVYGGGRYENARTNAAIASTRDEVVTYGGEVILAAFHSTSAGPTEDVSERWSMALPYLQGVSCPRDETSPYYQWEQRIDLERVEEGLRRMGFPVGPMATLTPLSYSKAGRVLTVRILHGNGELILRADDLRAAVGTTLLRSTAFELVNFGKRLLFRGRGYGHGVGLCQWGAKVLAEQGVGYREILRYYYPGTALHSYSSLKRP